MPLACSVNHWTAREFLFGFLVWLQISYCPSLLSHGLLSTLSSLAINQVYWPSKPPATLPKPQLGPALKQEYLDNYALDKYCYCC